MSCSKIAIGKMYVVRWLREGFKLKEQSDKTRDLSIGVLFQWYHSLFSALATETCDDLRYP